MTAKLDLVTALTALGVASYMAIILRCLAHDEFGLPDRLVCKCAVLGALLIASALGVGSLGWRANK